MLCLQATACMSFAPRKVHASKINSRMQLRISTCGVRARQELSTVWCNESHHVFQAQSVLRRAWPHVFAAAHAYPSPMYGSMVHTPSCAMHRQMSVSSSPERWSSRPMMPQSNSKWCTTMRPACLYTWIMSFMNSASTSCNGLPCRIAMSWLMPWYCAALSEITKSEGYTICSLTTSSSCVLPTAQPSCTIRALRSSGWQME